MAPRKKRKQIEPHSDKTIKADSDQESISAEQIGHIEPNESVSVEQIGHIETSDSVSITLTTSPEMWLSAEGGRLYREGNYGPAVDRYRKVIGLSGARSDDHLNFADALYRNGDFASAIDEYKKIIALIEASAQTNNDQQGTLDHEADELQFDLNRALNNLGVALDATLEYDEAIDSEMKVISRDPTFAEAYNNLGCALEHAGRHVEAIKEYEEAVKYSSNSSTGADAKKNLSAGSACKDLLFDIVRIAQ